MIYCNLKLVVNKPSYKVLKYRTFLIYQGTNTHVNIQGIYRLVLCDNKVLQQLLCSRKDTSREESSVNRKIFIVLKHLHAELPGLTMLDFFGHFDNKVWNITKEGLEHKKT